jgi:SAM-dependent methyltransferase
LADLHLRLSRELGFELECKWLEEILRWPAEWSALHGIAEIRTPVVKIVTLTDATPGKLRVRYQGTPTLSPEHAGTGLVFPFRRKSSLPLILSRAFQLGLANPITVSDEVQPFIYAPWYARDNGFVTRYVMDRSQAPLVERVKELLAEQPVQAGRARVLELGCRNGALLRKICTLSPVLTLKGIDRDPEKIAHAILLHPNAPPGTFTVADPFGAPNRDLDEDTFLTILMLGRLVEIPVAVARAVCNIVCRSTRHLLVYAYDDYVRQIGSLSEMAGQIGLELRDITKTATIELAWAAGPTKDSTSRPPR